MLPRIDISNVRPVPARPVSVPGIGPLPVPGQPLPGHPAARQVRARRGRTAHFSGLAAEDAVARDYGRRGMKILHRRHRTPEGELDLIVGDGDLLVFVEVKKRKRPIGPDSPISNRQWQRLENAAEHYMMVLFDATGIRPIFRFDVALVDGAGQVTIIENARVVDEF